MTEVDPLARWWSDTHGPQVTPGVIVCVYRACGQPATHVVTNWRGDRLHGCPKHYPGIEAAMHIGQGSSGEVEARALPR